MTRKQNEAGRPIGTEIDLDDLMRMDTATLVKASAEAIKGGGMAPNEARARYLELGPVAGGESAVPAATELQPRGAGQARRAGRSVCGGRRPPAAAPDEDAGADREAAGAGAWLTRQWAPYWGPDQGGAGDDAPR